MKKVASAIVIVGAVVAGYFLLFGESSPSPEPKVDDSLKTNPTSQFGRPAPGLLASTRRKNKDNDAARRAPVQGVSLPMPDPNGAAPPELPPEAPAPAAVPEVELDANGKETYEALSRLVDDRIAAGTWRPDDQTVWAASTGAVHPDWIGYLQQRFDTALRDGKLKFVEQ